MIAVPAASLADRRAGASLRRSKSLAQTYQSRRRAAEARQLKERDESQMSYSSATRGFGGLHCPFSPDKRARCVPVQAKADRLLLRLRLFAG